MKTHYKIGMHPVTGVGLGLSRERLDEALSGTVAAIVFDDEGIEEVKFLLDGLADTDFARENMDSLFSYAYLPENWRVGEALAENYLVEHRNCYFPWPDGRDERKRGSSLPGADLVGFQLDGNVDRFAFGEVKTSCDEAYPPSAAYGRHGLKQQMEDLRNRKDIRDVLVLYLAHRAVNAGWRERFRAASAVYLRNTCDVRIFGLLIRDVSPHEDDLRARGNKLAQDCPPSIVIELTAIYLPKETIASLSDKVVASRKSGGDV